MMWILFVCVSFISYAQVEQAWVRRYVTASDEAPVAVKTNGSAVYVLGQTNQFSSASDFILIKYNSSGTFIWSQTYNGTGNDEDRPVAMTLDAAGNIYVVGKSRISFPAEGVYTGQTVTLKYNSDGALLWSAIKLRADHFPCEPNDVQVDALGNVYVAGSTINGDAFAYDFMTIKYNSSGAEQWIRTYNGTANSIDMDTRLALDRAGNIYVTGESQGILKRGKLPIQTFADVYTIKYNPNGGIMWQRRYNSPFNSGDRPNAIALDNAGNVYITGSSNTDPNNSDYLTLKLNGGDGTVLYTARYNGTGNAFDEANGIVVNAAGEAFVTGSSDPYGNGNFAVNYVTIKYTSAGAEAWTASYNGPADGRDLAHAIRMDGFGFIYVTGESQADSYDFATLQYGNSGIELWRARYDGAFLSDKAIDMAVYTPPGPAFEQAHVYVVGESEGVGNGLDIALVKYEQPLVIGEFSTSSGLSNYPNPFTETTTIEYSLTYDSDVSIRIIDPFTSKEIRKISIGEKSAGKNNYAFSANGLKPGNYIYKIEANSSSGKFTETKVMQVTDR
jgi:hypothetical protein